MSYPAPGTRKADLAWRFPGHSIDRQRRWDRVQYVARARSLDVHPYAVVAGSLDELCSILEADQPARPEAGPARGVR